MRRSLYTPSLAEKKCKIICATEQLPLYLQPNSC